MNNVIFRSFTEGDYEMACQWWEWWWKGESGIEREILPDDKNCYVIEHDGTPVVVGFLFVCENAPMGYLTWIVSNPNYRGPNRKKLLRLFILNAEHEASQLGVKFMFTVCGDKYLREIHKELEWFVDETRPAYEAFKYLYNGK